MLTVFGFLILFCCTTLFIIQVAKKDLALSIIIFSGICIRFIVAILQEYYHIAPYSWDEAAFYNMGSKVYYYLIDERLNFPFDQISGVATYGSILGGIFYLFDPSTLLARLINSSIGSFIIFAIYKLARELDVNRKGALIVASVMAFTPSGQVIKTGGNFLSILGAS